ncbi:MAG: DUF3592 domain-containing protein [Pseudomonadota bacterium]
MDHRDDLKGVLGAFILFGAVAASGVVAAYAAVEDYARARASRGWPTVDGVVLSRDGEEDGVRYAWFDGEVSHTGERVRFWTGALYASGAVYEPGEQVKVRVSPEDGAVAVIEPGGSAVIFAVALAFGAFLVFIGLAGLIRLTMLIDGLAPHAREGRFDVAPAE